MKKKKISTKYKHGINNTKLLFLSIILLFIIFEALFLLKNQKDDLQATRLEQNVAGASVSK